MSRAEAVAVFAVIASALLVGYLLGSHRNAPGQRVVVKTDTLTIRDTIVRTEPFLVEILRTEYDTCWLTLVDTVEKEVQVEVPIEYKHTAFKDADIYHHGFQSVIDSVSVYPETKYITTEKTIKEKAPMFGVGVSVGYGICGKGFSPYLGVGLHYTLVPIKRK